MSDQRQRQDEFDAVLKLIEEGKIEQAVQRIVDGNTSAEPLELLRMLSTHVIEWMHHIQAARSDLHDLQDRQTLLRLRELAGELARVHIHVRVLILALARTQVSNAELTRAFANAQELADELARAFSLEGPQVKGSVQRSPAEELARDFAIVRELAHTADTSASESSTSEPISDTREAGEERSLAEVVFSAFYPRQIEREVRGGFFLYAHLETALKLVEHDIMKFREELGAEVPVPKRAKEKVRLKPGTIVTIVLESDELEFNPPMLAKRWEPDWVRFEFDFKAAKELLGETAIVNVSIQVGGIEIATIKRCAVEIIDKKVEKPTTRPPTELAEKAPTVSAVAFSENRLAKAKAEFDARMASRTGTPYQRIFVSYSRKDVEVVRAYRAAQEALGNDVFVDTESIHTGEDWMARLAIEIDRANVFQLFWSENSATSQFVQEEWEYALQYKCPEDKCVEIIRPVYWKSEMPNPKPPKALAHLHFRHVAFGA